MGKGSTEVYAAFDRTEADVFFASVRGKYLSLFLFWLLTWLGLTQYSWGVEATWEYSVQVSATIQTSPPQIILSWPQDSTGSPQSYTVYRKGIDDLEWGVGTTLSGQTTSYVDSNVNQGDAYEYRIIKQKSGYFGYGYIYAGVNAQLVESRGKLILVVDNSFTTSLETELARLQRDIVGDGWTVVRHDVSRSNSVTEVKAVIQGEYQADPLNVKAVFLVGHVPVPYSGNIAPDDHVPEHKGAWPADVYYGDMDGTWTDYQVNNANAEYPRNRNIPGDGKFDQSVMPAPVQLMVGRVDLANMPGKPSWDSQATFPGELELLRNYLNKDHDFRHNLMMVPRRGLIGDYFGTFSNEAFAATGWRNFAPLFGADNVLSLPNQGTWLSTLQNNSYLWAYACGAGAFNTMAGMGNQGEYHNGSTTDLVDADINAVFVILFGSWMGDWDSEDNLMRSVLATPTYGLASFWGGRPHWFFHHMGLGEPIGYSTRLTQNNAFSGLYENQENHYPSQIHIALMGDPTLRMHPVTPPANLILTSDSGGAQLSWSPSTDVVVGYNVYRATETNGPYIRVNGSLIADNSFTDYSAGEGSYTYMVRAVKLEATPSGNYYNASQGIFTDGEVSAPGLPVITVTASSNVLSRVGSHVGTFTFKRTGNSASELPVFFELSGTATEWRDYEVSSDASAHYVLFSPGVDTVSFTLRPRPVWTPQVIETVVLIFISDPGYTPAASNNNVMVIAGNCVSGVGLQQTAQGPKLTWQGESGKKFHIAYMDALDIYPWTDFGLDFEGQSAAMSWIDTNAVGMPMRFYSVFEVP